LKSRVVLARDLHQILRADLDLLLDVGVVEDVVPVLLLAACVPVERHVGHDLPVADEDHGVDDVDVILGPLDHAGHLVDVLGVDGRVEGAGDITGLGHLEHIVCQQRRDRRRAPGRTRRAQLPRLAREREQVGIDTSELLTH
jgi:hypothetical protein